VTVLAVPLAPPDFACVVAADRSRGIGRAGRLPWPRLPADVAHLKAITTRTRAPEARNAVIMGRRTWDTIPRPFRPLPGRLNVVLSRAKLPLPPGVLLAQSFAAAVTAATGAGVEGIFVLGGGQIYAEAVADPHCKVIYYTRIETHLPADTHFPPFELSFIRDDEASEPHREAGLAYTIERWHRRESSGWGC
jgi:dihydrofolate reductase